MKAELARRQSLEDRLLAFILAHPRSWLHGRDLRPHGGDAWRSRLPNIRKRLAERGLTFGWNGKNGQDAAYMLREQPLGRDASDRVTQVSLW